MMSVEIKNNTFDDWVFNFKLIEGREIIVNNVQCGTYVWGTSPILRSQALYSLPPLEDP